MLPGEMMQPSVPNYNPIDEEGRLAALIRYHVLDTPVEKQFDDLVKLAGQICQAPIALISLVDRERQWFKAKVGIDASETPRSISACQYTIQQSEVMQVPDTLEDPRFVTNPLVTGDPHMRFYAGAPLITPAGERIGTICVLDTKPRALTPGQIEALEILSHQVMTLLELRFALHQKMESEHELKILRDESAQTAKQYQLLFNSMEEGFCVIEMLYDAQGQPVDYIFRQTNPAFETYTGIQNAKDRRMSAIAAGHETHWFTLYDNVLKTGESARFTNHAAALGRWFDVYAFRTGEVGNYLVAVLFSDATGHRRAELALNESQAQLNLMVESAKDYAIISMSNDGIIKTWNTGAERIFRYQPHQVIGQPFTMIFTDEDCASGAPAYEMSTAAQKGRASDERWHERADGSRFYASGILAAMYDAKQNVTGFVKIARDMTEQQRHQEMLLEARNSAEAANIAKTEFLANMSHEIRTPMNAIIGLSNILSMSVPLTEKQRQFVKTLQMSADSLLSLINDLLDISKIEARSVELEHIPFSLTQLIQEVISMMAVRVKENGLNFTSDGESVDRHVFIGDPTRLRQIILNLCSNAIKFTEKGGIHIAIGCSKTTKPSVENITISVTDTGIGIEADKLNVIFDKFIQADTSISRRYGGTGLGLAITKTITEIMGGTIEVQSVYGQGSTFTVTIPLQLATAEEIQTSDYSLATVATQTIERQIQPRVLLVEDYAPNILVASTILEQFGYVVEVATDGQQAIDMVKANPYVAALMDVQMHGMNGFEATQAIRANEKLHHLPRLPIIGMTAHALAGDRERCLSVGMDDYLAKPFNPDELHHKLNIIVEEGGADTVIKAS